MTTPLQPVDVNTPAIKRKVARAVSNDRLHLAVETVYPFSVPRETGPKATFTDKKKYPPPRGGPINICANFHDQTR